MSSRVLVQASLTLSTVPMMYFHENFQMRVQEEVGRSHVSTVGWLFNCYHLFIEMKAGQKEGRGSRESFQRDPLQTCRVSHKTLWQPVAQSNAASRLTQETKKKIHENACPYFQDGRR